MTCEHLHLQKVDAMSSSCFPDVERWLSAESDRQAGLRYVCSRKSMDRYRSVMDFLLCETLPKYRRHCTRYYEDRGPRLIRMTDRATRKEIGKLLLDLVKLCHQTHKRELYLSWPQASGAAKKMERYREDNESFDLLEFLQWALPLTKLRHGRRRR